MAPKLSTLSEKPKKEPWLILTKRGLVFAEKWKHHKKGELYVMKKTFTAEGLVHTHIINCSQPDQTTPWVCKKMTHRQKKDEIGFQLHEMKNMAAADGESHNNRDPMPTSQGKSSSPRFHNGEALGWWWASWFKTAQEPPEKCKQKQRPKWFDARVYFYIGVKKVRYGGVEFEGHTYRMH